jgi:hypothetical protein
VDNANAKIVRIGGWCWRIDIASRSLRFVGSEDCFGHAVRAVEGLSNEHMSRLSVLVDYIENLPDDIPEISERLCARCEN